MGGVSRLEEQVRVGGPRAARHRVRGRELGMATEWVPLISAVAGLAGVWLGSRLTAVREQIAYRRTLIERQLRELYGPLLATRAEILSLSGYRLTIEETMDSVWRDQVERTREAGLLDPDPEGEFRSSVDAD